MLRRTTRCLVCLLVAPFSLGVVEAREVVGRGDVVVVPLRGEVSPSLALFLRRAQKAAETQGAAAIVLDMNTYGGRLDSAEKITGILNHATIPTYTYINTNAGSAGALIALSTKHIYMAPVSAIGAAAPILPTGEDLPPTQKEKTVSYWSALIRGAAQRNGHNPDIGEAFINKEKEVKIGDRVIHPKGSLLTLNAQDATEKINGKPVLAEGIAESLPDLVKMAGLKGDVVQFEPSGFERIGRIDSSTEPFALGVPGATLRITYGKVWPALANETWPLGEITAAKQVIRSRRPPTSRIARSIACSTTFGEMSMCAVIDSASTAPRPVAAIIALGMPWPVTSPTTTSKRPSVSWR